MIRTGLTSRVALWAALFSFVATIASMTSDGAAQPTFAKDKLTLVTAAGSHVIAIEIAESDAAKSLGLMYRQTVPPDTGMLFPYDKPQELTMWMRNTYASLDMIFIKPDGTVHRIEYGTEPLSEKVISSRGPVIAVLELAAGEAKRLGLTAGDRVEHTTFRRSLK